MTTQKTMQELLEELHDGRPKKIILDTDTYNEADDQFALAYAMRSPGIELLSVNAAPFVNRHAETPEEGMLRSYDEARRVMELTDPGTDIPLYRGSRGWLPDRSTPQASEAADNIIRTARAAQERIWVVAIGAITNVASAILAKPSITRKLGVIWLGGHSFGNASPREFNMRLDIPGAQVLFDSDVPLMQIPAFGGSSVLCTSVPELRAYIGGRSALCDYLINLIVTAQGERAYARSRVIWDLAGIAALTLPDAFCYTVIPKPAITADGNYAQDLTRSPYLYVRRIDRDKVFADVFRLLARETAE